MSYNEKEFYEYCKSFIQKKRNFDILKMESFDSKDIDVCKYVSLHLDDIDLSNRNFGRKITFNELKKNSIDELKIFNDNEILNRICKILSNVSIYRHDGDIFQFSTEVVYSVVGKKNKIDFNSSRVDCYNIPEKIYEGSVFFMVHEYMHSLKDTNYYEYRYSYVFGEIIPLFYELLIYDENIFCKRQILKSRLFDLNLSKDDFVYASEFINDNEDFINNKKNDLYKFVRSTVGVYLNSFYYAVILYDLYKDNPKKILGLVLKVLKHEMTTIDMLKKLNIYDDIKDDIFESRLGNIKKRLR